MLIRLFSLLLPAEGAPGYEQRSREAAERGVSAALRMAG